MKRFLASAMTFFGLAAAALAQGGGPTPAPGTPAPGGAQANNVTQMVITIALMFAIFYFVILRPQKKEQRKREELLNSVAKGDSVITTAGIYGTVESVDATKGTVTVAVAPKVSIKFTRSAISQIEKKRGGKEESAETSAS